MIADRLKARSFRGYERLEVELGERVTLVTGDNGAGKTNLLEALYFGCVGRSCRTHVDAQAIAFEQPVARVEVVGHDSGEQHTLAVAIERGAGKTFFADGARADSFEDFTWRPPVAVFMPDRLELVNGAPGIRRAHLDQFVAALWPARRAAKHAYGETLGQRNALLTRGGGSQDEMHIWDLKLARAGLRLIQDRAAATAELDERFALTAEQLGLADSPELCYRSAAASSEEEFVAELVERRAGDLARGFTSFGPHRDELVLRLAGREVRTYGSRGQQRSTLLALLLAECEAIAELTARRPLIMLDDVMSELDATRRALLVGRVERLGQVLITATESGHVPDGVPLDRVIEVAAGKASVVA